MGGPFSALAIQAWVQGCPDNETTLGENVINIKLKPLMKKKKLKMESREVKAKQSEKSRKREHHIYRCSVASRQRYSRPSSCTLQLLGHSKQTCTGTVCRKCTMQELEAILLATKIAASELPASCKQLTALKDNQEVTKTLEFRLNRSISNIIKRTLKQKQIT